MPKWEIALAGNAKIRHRKNYLVGNLAKYILLVGKAYYIGRDVMYMTAYCNRGKLSDAKFFIRYRYNYFLAWPSLVYIVTLNLFLAG